MRQRWPSKLWVVRHGESAGNVARDLADAVGAAMIDIEHRDMDVPLSELGERQARSLGHWFRAMPEGERPEVVLASPYVRAVRTAELIGGAERVIVDERLREREFGILDRLTNFGIRERFPEQAEHRRILGKFYHRPPGGESWCDVILRLRSALDTISLHYADRRVLIVGHQVVVLCLRYILEDLSEAEILAIDKASDVANCGVTEYGFEPDCPDECRPVMRRYNFTAPLDVEGTPVTTAPDARVAAK